MPVVALLVEMGKGMVLSADSAVHSMLLDWKYKPGPALKFQCHQVPSHGNPSSFVSSVTSQAEKHTSNRQAVTTQHTDTQREQEGQASLTKEIEERCYSLKRQHRAVRVDEQSESRKKQMSRIGTHNRNIEKQHWQIYTESPLALRNNLKPRGSLAAVHWQAALQQLADASADSDAVGDSDVDGVVTQRL